MVHSLTEDSADPVDMETLFALGSLVGEGSSDTTLAQVSRALAERLALPCTTVKLKALLGCHHTVHFCVPLKK